MLLEQDITRFRIYTEDVAPTDKRVQALGITPAVLVAFEFGRQGYTMYRAMGYWKDTSEPSIVFEILRPADQYRCVLKVAAQIQDRCGQEVVIVTTDRVHQVTLTGD